MVVGCLATVAMVQQVDDACQDAAVNMTVLSNLDRALACRYHADVPSEELGTVLRTDASVLVAPGIYFGIEYHFRITFGMDPAKLAKALPRITDVLKKYPRT
jgi:aspartate/methionine/tyrosine aminotransferase